jgi:UDP-glucose 4-epimerase
VRDYVHVEDSLSALSALVRCGARDEIYNVGSGRGRSVREVLDVIRHVTGRELALERVPGEYAGVQRSVLDVSRLRTRTGWAPEVELEEGIAHLWASFAERR